MSDKRRTTVCINLPPDFLEKIRGRKRIIKDAPSKSKKPLPPPLLPQSVHNDFEELLQNLYDGTLITTLDGKILNANPRAIDFLIYEHRSIRRRNYWRRHHRGFGSECVARCKARPPSHPS